MSTNHLGLPDRQWQVLTLVAQGLTNRQICDALFVGPDTVRTHIRLGFARIGAQSRTEAAQIIRDAQDPDDIRREINDLSRRLARLIEEVKRRDKLSAQPQGRPIRRVA